MKCLITYTVYSILIAIQNKLMDPNGDSPANVEAAQILKNKNIFYERVRKKVVKSWKELNEDI